MKLLMIVSAITIFQIVGLKICKAATDIQIKAILNLHNKYRQMHGAQPLVHDPEISAISQSYADKLAASGGFEHSGNTYNGDSLGENLAKWWGSESESDSDGSKAVELWYAEKSSYDFSLNSFQYSAGHFSQMIWKDSKSLGIGIAQSSDNSVTVVCNYYPAGNVLGLFNVNVLPSTSLQRKRDFRFRYFYLN